MVAQPLATVLRAMTRTGPVINERCAVVGTGSMGLVWVHMLWHMGARQVIGVDRLAWRLEWARRFGAQATVDASKEDVVERVKELTGTEKADFCVCAAAEADALATASWLVRHGGRLFVFGMPDYNDQKFPWYATFRNETQIITCVGPECGAYFQTAADMVVDGRADLGAMVTPRLPWQKAPEAFEMYADRAPGCLKVMLEL
jgi:S-(hydroxymethyl)mycothiol dehydrogenase